MALANEAVLATLRRKELEEIQLRISETLQNYEIWGAGAGEDGDGSGDGEEGSFQDQLMVLLMDYMKTCNARRSLLVTMDAGLAKLLKEVEKEQVGDASGDSWADSVVTPLIGEQQPVEMLAAEVNYRKQVLQQLHGQQVSMLREHITSMETPLAASEQRSAQVEGELALVVGQLSRANADLRALADEVLSLEGQGKAVVHRLKQQESLTEAKARTQLGNLQQMKADLERERMRTQQLEVSSQALAARHNEELDTLQTSLQSSLNEALAQRDAARAELHGLQSQQMGFAGDLQADLDEARRQLAEQKNSALRMHETSETRRSDIEAEREVERKEAQAEFADMGVKMTELRQKMQEREKELQEHEAKMLGSYAEELSQLKGQLKAKNTQLAEAQQELDAMTTLRDTALATAQERDEAKRQLEEAKRQLQAAHGELAASQAVLAQPALEQATQPPPAEPIIFEEAQLSLEADRQARLKGEAEMSELVIELEAAKAALARERVGSKRRDASLTALCTQVQQSILEPVMIHWPGGAPSRSEPEVIDALDGAPEPSAELRSSLEEASAQLLGLLTRDKLERKLLQQELEQAEAFAPRAAAREPPQPEEDGDEDLLAGLEEQSAVVKASSAATAAQQHLQQQQTTAILAAVLFKELTSTSRQTSQEILSLLAQSGAGIREAEVAGQEENAKLRNSLADEREAAQALERQLSAAQDVRNALELKLRKLEKRLEAEVAIQQEAQESVIARGEDGEKDNEVSELLVANQLQLTSLHAREKELLELTSELEEAREQKLVLGVNCSVLATELDRAEKVFNPQHIMTERQLLKNALLAQRELTVAESRASALRMSRLAVRSQLLQVLHAATLGCDVSLMEPALKEAEEREAEIEAAHRQAQTDVKRARGGLAAAERKLEMGQQAEMQNVQTLDEEEKVRGEAVAKLQAQIRGHSARNAMHELSIPSPSEAARRCTSRDGIKHSVSTRIQTTPSGCDEDGESGLPNAQTRGPSSAVPAVGQAQSFGVRLPAGCDGGVLEEVSMRSAAKGALLRVESILCLSKIRTMSMEMAEHTSAQMTLEAKVRSGLRTTMERLRTAFPQLAWHASSGTELSAESLREASASVLRLTAVVPGAADYSQGQPLGLSFKEPAHPADDQEDYGSVGSRTSEENPAAADETVPLQPSASKTIRQELFVCECLHAMAALADFVERAAVMHAEAEQVAAARAKAAEATRAEAVDSMALPTAATSTSAAEADAAEGASDPAAAHEPKRVALPPRRTPGTEASRDADAVTTPKQVELADAAVQVGRDEHDRPAPSMVQAPKPAHIEPRQLQSPAVVSADAGCSPHASPREILRMMLQESGLLDTADPCRAHEHEPSGPEGAMAKLVRTFQWDDRVRQSTDAELGLAAL